MIFVQLWSIKYKRLTIKYWYLTIIKSNIYNKKRTKCGLSSVVEIREISMQKMIPPMGSGSLIINPPYGERMETYQLDLLYKHIELR